MGLRFPYSTTQFRHGADLSLNQRVGGSSPPRLIENQDLGRSQGRLSYWCARTLGHLDVCGRLFSVMTWAESSRIMIAESLSREKALG